MAERGRGGRDDGFLLQLDGRRQDASRARAFLETLLPRLGWGPATDDATLLVTELVANVVLHARTACAVRVTADDDELRVIVKDESPALPRLRHFSEDSTTGRGLRLVERLADTWGSSPLGAGKEVWFAFDRTGLQARAEGVASVADLRTPASRRPMTDQDLESVLPDLGGWDDDDVPGPVSRLRLALAR